ncbi:oxidoreductase-like domain-containing protein [Fodinibius sediminis]|nr:oxidoreductase-like domain-containing protein [Fodinibius sediminis]
MRKPLKPLPTDCCGSGCTRCIFDIYRDQMVQYKKWKKEQQEEDNKTNE